jgi:hypothetical protein
LDFASSDYTTSSILKITEIIKNEK